MQQEKELDLSMCHDFILGPVDTDSISFCKPDMSPFTEEEREALLNEINALMPSGVQYADDGYFETAIVIKAKNYVLWDGKKLKYKGSAIKATTKEPALQQFIKDIIQIILDNRETEVIHKKSQQLYMNYVSEIMDVKDIKRWSSKKTITDKVLKNERTNEAKVRDAISDSEYVEGDKIYVYFKEDGSLGLVENYNNDHDRTKLLKKLHSTVKTFETVLPVKELFINYSLVKTYKTLVDNTQSLVVG
jgi:hypothetical protein